MTDAMTVPFWVKGIS